MSHHNKINRTMTEIMDGRRERGLYAGKNERRRRFIEEVRQKRNRKGPTGEKKLTKLNLSRASHRIASTDQPIVAYLQYDQRRGTLSYDLMALPKINEPADGSPVRCAFRVDQKVIVDAKRPRMLLDRGGASGAGHLGQHTLVNAVHTFDIWP
jgi:hypothetical protein